MELGLILGRNLEKGKIWAFFKVFQGLIFYFCRFPGFSRFFRFSRSPGNPDLKVKNSQVNKQLLKTCYVQLFVLGHIF